jgi:hypothetical protein
MFEPVTITSSIVTPERLGDGAGDISWPNVIEAESRKIPGMLFPLDPINGRLITLLSRNSSAVLAKYEMPDKAHVGYRLTIRRRKSERLDWFRY